MMNLKDLKVVNPKNSSKSGFMLTEVLIALAIVGMLITPIFYLISNSLRASARFRKKTARLFVMKNFMVQQNYEALQSNDQKKGKDLKVKDPAVLLKYTQDVVKKIRPFDKFSKNELENLCVQKVVASFGRKKEKIVSFLYKPRL